MELPQAYLARMRAMLGEEGCMAYLEETARPPRRALRVNTLKASPERLLPLLGEGFVPDGVCPEGFLTPEGFACGKHPLHQAGLFYMQEASAQLPALLTGAKPGMAVLTCAPHPAASPRSWRPCCKGGACSLPMRSSGDAPAPW